MEVNDLQLQIFFITFITKTMQNQPAWGTLQTLRILSTLFGHSTQATSLAQGCLSQPLRVYNRFSWRGFILNLEPLTNVSFLTLYPPLFTIYMFWTSSHHFPARITVSLLTIKLKLKRFFLNGQKSPLKWPKKWSKIKNIAFCPSIYSTQSMVKC